MSSYDWIAQFILSMIPGWAAIMFILIYKPWEKSLKGLDAPRKRLVNKVLWVFVGAFFIAIGLLRFLSRF